MPGLPRSCVRRAVPGVGWSCIGAITSVAGPGAFRRRPAVFVCLSGLTRLLPAAASALECPEVGVEFAAVVEDAAAVAVAGDAPVLLQPADRQPQVGGRLATGQPGRAVVAESFECELSGAARDRLQHGGWQRQLQA